MSIADWRLKSVGSEVAFRRPRRSLPRSLKSKSDFTADLHSDDKVFFQYQMPYLYGILCSLETYLQVPTYLDRHIRRYSLRHVIGVIPALPHHLHGGTLLPAGHEYIVVTLMQA